MTVTFPLLEHWTIEIIRKQYLFAFNDIKRENVNYFNEDESYVTTKKDLSPLFIFSSR